MSGACDHDCKFWLSLRPLPIGNDTSLNLVISIDWLIASVYLANMWYVPGTVPSTTHLKNEIGDHILTPCDRNCYSHFVNGTRKTLWLIYMPGTWFASGRFYWGPGLLAPLAFWTNAEDPCSPRTRLCRANRWIQLMTKRLFSLAVGNDTREGQSAMEVSIRVRRIYWEAKHELRVERWVDIRCQRWREEGHSGQEKPSCVKV